MDAEQQTVWLVTRGEDPGAIPCEDEATARAWVEAQYLGSVYSEDAAAAVLRWDDDGELMDDSIPGNYQGTGWTVREEEVIRAADFPNAERSLA